MFSIADIQAEQEADFEELPEGEEASEDQPSHSYPIRCSFAITKVSHFFFVHVPIQNRVSSENFWTQTTAVQFGKKTKVGS